MEKKTSWHWVPRASALSGLLLLVGSGCMKDLDALSANYGNGGGGAGHAGGKGASGAHTGGSSASGGEAADSGEGGEGGEAGEQPVPSGGRGGTGGRGSGGSGGRVALGGGTCEDNGLSTCEGVKGCVDLAVGTPADTTTENCGMCGTICSLDNANSATCAAALCTPTCKSGFGDCNASMANDGCESDITTAAHCGSCQNACSTFGTTSAQCAGSTCIPTCAPSYADCNGSQQPAPNDGCEFFFDALEHCTTGCSEAFVACDPTKVCNVGSCVAPDGIAILSTPLTTSGDQTRFADVFPGFPLDLTGSSVRVRVYAPGATGGTIKFFVSDNSSAFGAEVILGLTALNQKWTDVVVPIAGVNAKQVKQVNMLVVADGATFANPTTVYVDSVRTTNQLVNETFDANVGGFVKSSIVAVPGASVAWTAAMP
jgi:hypothetical protein